MHMSDFLDAKLKEIRDRLGELRPLIDEFKRLEAAEPASSKGARAPMALAACMPGR